MPRLRLLRSSLGLMAVALALLGTGAILLSTAFDTEASARLLGGNAPVNVGAASLLDVSAHNSPTVARSPVDGARLAIANRLDQPGFSCALHLSPDSGATWSQLPIPAPRGEEGKCFAPDVASGADGTLHLSFVTLKGRGNVPHAVWTSTLRPGARALSTPVRAGGPLSFQVRLSADPDVPGRLYLTWLQAADVGLLRFTGPGNPIRFARSDDGGRRWGPHARVSGAARGRVVAASLARGPGRGLYVVYLDLGDDRLDYEGGHQGRGGPPYPGPWRLVLSRSLNGGASWEENVIDEVVPTERFLAFLPSFPSLAIDRRRNVLYAAFHDGRLGDADVRLWSSADRGATWSGPRRINDTPRRDRTAQYLPRLAVAPNGRLDVLYYDRRSDPRNVMNDVSLQSSFDGGKTFTDSLRLTDRPFSSRIGFGSERGMPDLGSRLGLVSSENRALAVWTDTRAGGKVPGKQDLTRAVVAIPQAPGLPGAVRCGLRYGGAVLLLAWLAVLAARVIRLRSRRSAA